MSRLGFLVAILNLLVVTAIIVTNTGVAGYSWYEGLIINALGANIFLIPIAWGLDELLDNYF